MKTITKFLIIVIVLGVAALFFWKSNITKQTIYTEDGSLIVTMYSHDKRLSFINILVSKSRASDIIKANDLPYILVLSSKNNIQAKIPIIIPDVVPYTASPDWFDKDGNQIFFPESEPKILNDFEFIISVPKFIDTAKLEVYDTDDELQDTITI